MKLIKGLIISLVVMAILGAGVWGYQTYLAEVTPLGTANVVVSGDFTVEWSPDDGYPDEVAFGDVARGSTSDPIVFTVSSESPEVLSIWGHSDADFCDLVWDAETVTPSTEQLLVVELEPQGGLTSDVSLALDVPIEATLDGKSFTIVFGSALPAVSGTITTESDGFNGLLDYVPASYDFTGIARGDDFIVTYTLTNNASKSVTVTFPAELADGTGTVLSLSVYQADSKTSLLIGETADWEITYTVDTGAGYGIHDLTLTITGG